MKVSNTLTQYMVAADANPEDVFAHHSVGVDSKVGLYVIDGQGREMNFSEDVQESVYEALFDFFVASGRWDKEGKL
jgi:hypothetical protein